MVSDNLFFILGNPRSGTSMFRLMLNSNKYIAVPPECGFALWLYEKYKDKNYKDYSVVNEFVKDVFTTKKFETWGLDESDLLISVVDSRPETYSELTISIYLAYANKRYKSANIFGDKNNYYIGEVAKLKKTFPGSKFILMVRDGRDVAVSYKDLSSRNIKSKYKPNLSNDIREIAVEWKRNNLKVIDALGCDCHVVRYEDLLLNTSLELRKVCVYLGVKYDEEMLKFYENNDEPKEFLQWKSKTLEEPDPKNIGRFKQELTLSEISEFDRIAENALTRFGYM